MSLLLVVSRILAAFSASKQNRDPKQETDQEAYERWAQRARTTPPKVRYRQNRLPSYYYYSREPSGKQ